MDTKVLPSYIQVHLKQIIQENGFIDYSVHTKPGSKPGDGFNSDILGITISENSSGKRLDFVCKICRESNSYIFFEREVLFYNELMPILAKFQEEKNLSKHDQFLSYPKCYAAVADEDRNEHIVIMEDIRLQGFKMLDRAKITPIEIIRLNMREFGKLHGLSIAMKDQRPVEFAIVTRTADIYGTICQRFMEEIFHRHFDCTINSLRNENHKNIMRYIKNNYSSYVNKCINSKTSDHFLVLSHGKIYFIFLCKCITDICISIE